MEPAHAQDEAAAARVPPEAAQATAELMAASGIRAIWNFAPITLDVPDEIIVENVELYASLAIFSRKLEERRKARAVQF